MKTILTIKSFFVQFVIIRVVRFIFKITRGGVLLPLLFCCLMVPKGGFEPPRGLPTTPSRWRVYQFHHFGNLLIQNPSHLPLTKGGVSQSPFGKACLPVGRGGKGGLFLRLRQRCLRLNRNLLRFYRSCLSWSFLHHSGSSFC